VEATLLATIEQLTDELAATREELAALSDDNQRLAARVEAPEAQVAEQSATTDVLDDRVDTLEVRPHIEWPEASKPAGVKVVDGDSDSHWDVAGAIQMCAREDVVEDINERIKALEASEDDSAADDESGEATPNPDGSTTPQNQVLETETPLEKVLQMPGTTAETSLSANQQRARAIAADIEQYATYNHRFNSYSLTATQLRTVRTARSDDGRVHHQTVKRVRDFLTELGDTEVTVKTDKGGTNRLVFNPDLVRQIERQQVAHGVVCDNGVGERQRCDLQQSQHSTVGTLHETVDGSNCPIVPTMSNDQFIPNICLDKMKQSSKSQFQLHITVISRLLDTDWCGSSRIYISISRPVSASVYGLNVGQRFYDYVRYTDSRGT